MHVKHKKVQKFLKNVKKIPLFIITYMKGGEKPVCRENNKIISVVLVVIFA